MALRGLEDYLYMTFKNPNVKVSCHRLHHASPFPAWVEIVARLAHA
jgi:hypothetical protein